MKKIVIYVTMIVGVLSCTSEEKEMILQLTKEASFKIKPPLVNNPPIAQIFNIDNSLDTVLISNRGSFISIPKNCFSDGKDNDVTNGITISLDEYLNPSDILLSGIPMVYMKSEDTMDFQSAGMCKISASSNHTELQIKEGKSIDIGLRNMAQENDYNLYYFDTLQGNWIEKETDLLLIQSNNLPMVPVNLQKVNPDKIVSIDIERYQLRPLYRMWHKSKFKMYGEAKIIETDSSVWWYDMSVLSSKNPDIFELKFNGVDENGKQHTQQMMVQPTIDSANYDNEMSFFYKNMRRYVEELQLVEADLKQSRIDAEKMDAMWEEQKVLDSAMYAEQWIQDSLNIIRQQEYYKVAETRVEVMRSFSINQMGLFNCDRFYKRTIVAKKQVGFMVLGVKTCFDNAYLVNKYDNAVLTYVPFFAGRYSIDFDSQSYDFVGILGGVIYMENIKISNDNDRFFDVDINKVTVEELKRRMS
jgi:hypothetical protein